MIEWEWLNWLINTGTNGAVLNFFWNNIVLLSVIAFATPWTWDNKLIDYIKTKIKKVDK